MNQIINQDQCLIKKKNRNIFQFVHDTPIEIYLMWSVAIITLFLLAMLLSSDMFCKNDKMANYIGSL